MDYSCGYFVIDSVGSNLVTRMMRTLARSSGTVIWIEFSRLRWRNHKGHDSKMKIAQVAPLYEAVPPKLYGGTERVVAYVTDALVELGHDVTLFASGEAETTATLVAGRDQAIRLH